MKKRNNTNVYKVKTLRDKTLRVYHHSSRKHIHYIDVITCNFKFLHSSTTNYVHTNTLTVTSRTFLKFSQQSLWFQCNNFTLFTGFDDIENSVGKFWSQSIFINYLTWLIKQIVQWFKEGFHGSIYSSNVLSWQIIQHGIIKMYVSV